MLALFEKNQNQHRFLHKKHLLQYVYAYFLKYFVKEISFGKQK